MKACRTKTFSPILLLIWLAALAPCSALDQSLTDEQLAEIRFEQKLNNNISLNLPFRDEQGKTVHLAQYFGKKPVVLILAYYQCPMLCTMVFNGMVESASDMHWSIGREFDVVCVSINPADTAALAMAKKQTYLKRYGRAGADVGWHFLTGDQAAIKQLAGEVGFHYAYDPVVKEYAHPSGLVILTPQGKVSRYLFGVTYSTPEFYSALRDASASQVGSPIQQLILLCFHYNPITGKYSAKIIVILRLLGAATIIGLIALIAVSICRKQVSHKPNCSGGALSSPPEAAALPVPHDIPHE